MSSLSSLPASTPTAARPRPLISPRLPAPLFRFDPGWLFLAVGITTIALTVLIPAQHDLEATFWQRDKALAVERQREERVANYGEYLAALKKNDEAVLLSLATVQLTKSPENRVPLLEPSDPSRTSASIFPSLEPAPVREPLPPSAFRRASTLDRWTTNSSTRLWLLAGGVMCILIGLLPAAKATATTRS
jgi:hypothetical protein